jgi:hypothetical protein
MTIKAITITLFFVGEVGFKFLLTEIFECISFNKCPSVH